MRDFIFAICFAGTLPLLGIVFLLISLVTFLRPQIYCRRYSNEFLAWGLILIGISFLVQEIEGGLGIIDISMIITSLAGGTYILHLLAKKREFYEKRRIIILCGFGYIILVIGSMYLDLVNSMDSIICTPGIIFEPLTIGNGILQGFILIGLALWLRKKYYKQHLHDNKYEGCNCPLCSENQSTDEAII